MTQRDYGKSDGSSALQSTGAIPEVWSGKPVNKSYPRIGRGVISNTDYSKDVNRRKKKKKLK